MTTTRVWLLRSLCALALLTGGAPLNVAFGQDSAVPPFSPPIWAKPDHFWFRRSMHGGNVWLNVNALHGVKEPLFDHQRLAIELNVRTGVEYAPLMLPFADPAMQFVVKYDGSNAYIQQGAMAIEFILGSNLWRCDLQIKWDWNRVPPTDYECLSRRPAPPTPLVTPTAPAKTSPDGKWQAFVHNHNLALRPATGSGSEMTMLTTDGTADNAYQAGSILWLPDSQGFTAYRVHADVWRSETINDNVKKFITKAQYKVPR